MKVMQASVPVVSVEGGSTINTDLLIQAHRRIRTCLSNQNLERNSDFAANPFVQKLFSGEVFRDT